ncbi:MAG TPA: Gfo/Idh/MocA family oxidoreductase [Bacteroidota bacterium]|nr:Gfo/Idh/MocA family oxidoreductase [Bacteroidota bacterium]
MALTRRTFIRSALALGVFTIVPRRVLGGPGYTPPSDELTKAVIGIGGMGHWHLGNTGARLVAVCDVDEEHMQEGMRLGGVKGYHDFREVLERKDIDVVHIATPPHWHALISIAAAKAGKDIWCEKPMTRTIAEGEKVVEAVGTYGRMFRVNTWFRFSGEPFYESGGSARQYRKLVRSGLLGWPLTVTIGAATGFNWKFYHCGRTDLTPRWIPPQLDYDFWLGPAPYKPYHPHRVHGTFRGYWDYDGGGLGDMGQHYLDPIQYILGKDSECPVAVEADAPAQHPDAVSTFRRIRITYADGCRIILEGEREKDQIPFIEGPLGSLFRDFRSTLPNLKEEIAGFAEPEPVITDFMESVRTRKKFALNEMNAHRSATLVNLCKISWQLGRPLSIDPSSGRCNNDDAANRLIDPPMRAPWHL